MMHIIINGKAIFPNSKNSNGFNWIPRHIIPNFNIYSRVKSNPFWKDSMPFFPRLITLVFDSLTIAKFFSFSHSIPRLIWSGERFVDFSSVSGVCFGLSFREVMIFFRYHEKLVTTVKVRKRLFKP
jgi:hypothetical protein